MGEWILTSSILIIFIILIRELCKDKIGPGARYALWFVVAVRLLVPVSFSESSLSVLNFLEWKETGQERTESLGEEGAVLPEIPEEAGNGSGSGSFSSGGEEVSTGEAGQGDSGYAFGGIGPYYGSRPEQPGAVAGSAGSASGYPERVSVKTEGKTESLQEYPPAVWRKALRGIWLTGAVLFAGIVLLLNDDYRRRVYFSRTKCRLSLESRLPAYLSPAVETPCMFGLISPAIYLTPGIERNEKKLRYVLCHENIHYRHHDNFWALIRVMCLCIHWYNPLVWAAAVMSRQDCELACDGEALKLLGEEERISYGRTLLDFSIQGDTVLNGLQLSTAVAGGKKQLKERLMMIVGQPRRHAGALAFALSLTVLVSAATFTGRVNGQERGNGSTEEEMQTMVMDTQGAYDGDGSGGKEREGRASSGREDYVESTSIVSINLKDGRDYTLKLGGETRAEDGGYRVSRLELNWIHDRVEERIQTIDLETVKVLYTRPPEEVRESGEWSYEKQEALYAKSLYTIGELSSGQEYGVSAEDERELRDISGYGVFVEDLNFDGYEDFYLQGSSEGANVPYYCYLWNSQQKSFEPGYMIPNLRVNKEEKILESATEDGNNVYSVKYYRFDEQNCLHMLRYTEENKSRDALFPSLDLTYCEVFYGLPAVDEWDYGTVYGGALTERFVCLAKQALTELYEMTGTKLDTLCYTVTSFGNISFGRTPEDIRHSRLFFERAYGSEAGFEDCIRQVGLSTERTVWFSPVTQWRVPEKLDEMTDLQAARWYFERLPLTEGEVLESIESGSDGYLIRAESGNYYRIFLQPLTRELDSAYGPYDTYPDN